VSVQVLEEVQREAGRAQPAVTPPERLRPAESPRREPAHPARPEHEAKAPGGIGEREILVADSLDAPVSLGTRPFAAGWRRVTGKSARRIEQELDVHGWRFFYLAPDAHARGTALSAEDAIRKALTRIFAQALEQGVNTIEMASVRTKAFLGIHTAEVVGKLRHIQESPYLFATAEEMRRRMSRIGAAVSSIRPRRGQLGRGYREYKAF
jgi:hypothetical protein